MTNRRQFLKTLTVAAAGAAAMKSFAGNSFGNLPKAPVGLQLWTLRDTIQNDTLNTLKQVSKAGYTLIEPYGYDGSFYGFSAKEFRKMANDLGLQITATHTGINAVNADSFIEKANDAGLKYLVLPSAGDRPTATIEDYKNLAVEMNTLGAKAQKAGLQFGYHNHSHEFKSIEGKVLYEILLRETDPALVCFELDLFWMVKGGFDPVDYFNNFPGRFGLWHIKDMASTGESTVIGSGTIDLKKIFAKAEKAGMKYFFVEQEEYKAPPIQCVAESFTYINEHLL